MKIGYPFYKELLEVYLSILRDKLGDSLISCVLYGSVARGEARPESDIDLMIILKNEERSYYRMLEPVLDAQRRLQQTETYKKLAGKQTPYLSFLLLSGKEAAENHNIYLDIIEDGIILYDPGAFMSGRLRRLKKRLAELGSTKVVLPDGRYYWDLKPDLAPGEVFEL